MQFLALFSEYKVLNVLWYIIAIGLFHFLHFEFTFYLHCCKALHSLIAAVCRQNPGQLPLPIQRQQAFIQQGTVRCVQLAIAGNTQYLPGLCAPENCVAKSGKKILAIFLLHNRNQQARGVGRVCSAPKSPNLLLIGMFVTWDVMKL